MGKQVQLLSPALISIWGRSRVVEGGRLKSDYEGNIVGSNPTVPIAYDIKICG